jgi:autotransporter family porin
MFVHSLHDRLGEPQWIEGQSFDNQDDKRRSGWLRLAGQTGESTSGNGNFTANTDSTLIQGGGDIARWNVGGEHGRLHLGGMLGYGEARSDASAVGNFAQARGETDGWSVGAYGTWYQNDDDKLKLGWYTDVWGAYGQFKNKVNGDTLPEVRYDSTALTLSGEAGYAMRVREDMDWVIEPQAQLIYVHYNEDNIFEANGTRINGSDGSGWISRLGLRTQRTWVSDDGKRTQPYLTVNWWHDTVGDALTFNNVALKDLYPENRYEVKAGVNADLTRGWTIWGNVGHQWGSQQFSASTVRLGAKHTW